MLAPSCGFMPFRADGKQVRCFPFIGVSNMAESFGATENGNPANAYADALARARQVGFY